MPDDIYSNPEDFSGFTFTWDADKNNINVQKHGITFKEASTVFSDRNAKRRDDTIHSILEDRFIIIGKSSRAKLLIVCHCFRNNNIIRIISARKASMKERCIYESED